MVSDDDLRERVPDTVPEDVELFTKGDDVWGRGEHGEFRLDPLAGTDEPRDDRCGVPLRYYEDRYGQIRFCGALTVGTFGGANYEHDEYCKHHQARHALMERAHELFEHGYFATNYVNFVEKLPPSKFLFAVEMVGGLFQMSRHEFDVTHEQRTIDTSESALIEQDSVAVELPIPQEETLSLQANELWTAACKEVMAQNMQEIVFSDGMSKQSVAATSDMEGQITDVQYEQNEHHLHLPISRLAKDIKEHLANGGVDLEEDDSGVVTFQKNDYTLSVDPTDSTDTADAEDHSEAATDFAETLEAEGDAEEIVVE